MKATRSAARCVVLGCLIAFMGRAAFADELAAISGRITDPHGLVVAGVKIEAANINTNITYSGNTNADGLYRIPNIPPGAYRIIVQKTGFAQIVKPGVDLHVQDIITVNFTMQVGSVSQTITVEGGAPLVNTESASVSTLIDRQFVENMPLNGRSFQNLILLTPGVVTNIPQPISAGSSSGEFSVNGQRTESNYYTVDGVSANVGINPTSPFPSASSGSLPASTSVGTTQGLVSVDALEEFRVQSSTYSAEYGRNPGGQFSLVTRSGTNQWHGTAFDYLRNNYFDANDWFNNFLGQPAPPLRQNDFGGTLSGPVEIPHLYNGKDKTFFFFSYEGLRLIQPQAASVSEVPTVALRQSAPRALQPVLNAFSVPNCPVSITSCTSDHGNGLGDFVGTWSNPGSIDSVSIRLDHMVTDKLRLFFRFSDTTSQSDFRQNGNNVGNPSDLQSTNFTIHTYTLGATSSLSDRISNELRSNFSSNAGDVSNTLTNFGGATPVDLFQLQGFPSGTKAFPQLQFNFNFGGRTSIFQSASPGEQKQWNLVDTLALSVGRHQLKLGFDFRRLTPTIQIHTPVAAYIFFSAASVQANSPGFVSGQSFASAFPVYTNFSAFAQDEWKVTPRLNLSMGLRWEVNPAPGSAKGILPYTVQGNSLSTLTLAPQGTALWNTAWFNFAPRLGAAYILRNTPGYETVIRSGGGVFFDTGQQLGSQGYNGPGFSSSPYRAGSLFGSPASFPVATTLLSPPIVNPPVAPYSPVYAFPSHLQLPYTLQWNVSAQQALGKSQALTVSYVGSHAARLLEQRQVSVARFNPNFGTVFFNQNGLTADYNALQIQVQRRLTNGLQALGSYTWAHSIDYGSFNASFPSIRGNSDFDVRHSLSAALSYDLPNHLQSTLARLVLGHWGLDDRFAVRTGFPVTVAGPSFVDPATGQLFNAGLSVAPGNPFYLYGPQYPGGRKINKGAFQPPPGCTFSSCPSPAQGNAPRNFLRGFGAWQMDLAVRREFPIRERLRVQFRAEAFNVFNHPNFGFIFPFITGSQFGQATQTLAQSLPGLSGLYQMGGPRSMQFALKVAF